MGFSRKRMRIPGSSCSRSGPVSSCWMSDVPLNSAAASKTTRIFPGLLELVTAWWGSSQRLPFFLRDLGVCQLPGVSARDIVVHGLFVFFRLCRVSPQCLVCVFQAAEGSIGGCPAWIRYLPSRAEAIRGDHQTTWSNFTAS